MNWENFISIILLTESGLSNSLSGQAELELVRSVAISKGRNAMIERHTFFDGRLLERQHPVDDGLHAGRQGFRA